MTPADINLYKDDLTTPADKELYAAIELFAFAGLWERKHDSEPYWQDEKDWLSTVGFLPTDDPEARLYCADIIGYLVGYADLSNTRALALLGDPDASAYELLFSFSTPEEGPVPRSGPLA